ncbi:MAG: HAD-IA family hydrolase [Planctomycetota bacterium]|jgi:putative hydrolase of the HAD superfamily|nr:HAD-IA family hydrolase [Planctomycetota bacterium]
MAKRFLRALFFDIDDTLYSSTDFAAKARQQAVQAMVRTGLRVDPEFLLAELLEVVREFGSNDSHHLDKLIKRLPPETVPEGAAPFIIQAGVMAYHQCKFRDFEPFADAHEVLRLLNEKKLLLGVISAGLPAKQIEKLLRLNILQLVECRHIFITEDVGIAKTNPKIYVRACQAIGAAPDECGYVGDNPLVDIDIPSRLGMRTFFSRRGGKYEKIYGDVQADHVIHNFWDLLEVIDNEYEIVPYA